VLKAKKNGKEDAALKVIETKNHASKIEAMKNEFKIFKQLTHSDYLVAVNEQFYLKDMIESVE